MLKMLYKVQNSIGHLVDIERTRYVEDEFDIKQPVSAESEERAGASPPRESREQPAKARLPRRETVSSQRRPARLPRRETRAIGEKPRPSPCETRAIGVKPRPSPCETRAIGGKPRPPPREAEPTARNRAAPP